MLLRLSASRVAFLVLAAVTTPAVASRAVAAADTRVQLFDRTNGGWFDLPAAGGVHVFDLREAGGELLRVRGRGR